MTPASSVAGDLSPMQKKSCRIPHIFEYTVHKRKKIQVCGDIRTIIKW